MKSLMIFILAVLLLPVHVMAEDSAKVKRKTAPLAVDKAKSAEQAQQLLQEKAEAEKRTRDTFGSDADSELFASQAIAMQQKLVQTMQEIRKLQESDPDGFKQKQEEIIKKFQKEMEDLFEEASRKK
jgi:predicted lipid-binding transport protein (Tim44 family)